jgi:uncharacterized damage-inducible protein DinB
MVVRLLLRQTEEVGYYLLPPEIAGVMQKHEIASDSLVSLLRSDPDTIMDGTNVRILSPTTPDREEICMTVASPFLKVVYDGWESHQQALRRAVTPLTAEQLAWRPAPNHPSVNELIGHIAGARLWWFYKMGAPGSAALARQIAPWATETFDAGDRDALNRWLEANLQWEEPLVKTPGESLKWLELSWQMIETTLDTWTVADLGQTYRHFREGKIYAVTRQWTIWRVMSHDLHHGGELALMLGLQGIAVPDLGDKGGHLTPWSLTESDA